MVSAQESVVSSRLNIVAVSSAKGVRVVMTVRSRIRWVKNWWEGDEESPSISICCSTVTSRQMPSPAAVAEHRPATVACSGRSASVSCASRNWCKSYCEEFRCLSMLSGPAERLNAAMAKPQRRNVGCPNTATESLDRISKCHRNKTRLSDFALNCGCDFGLELASKLEIVVLSRRAAGRQRLSRDPGCQDMHIPT